MVRRRKRWDRLKYPDNWEEISRTFRASRNYTCEYCGTPQGTWRISKAGHAYRSITAAAHRYPNDTMNPDPELLCLCERCHGRHDGFFRGIIEEGEHQAIMHDILIERWYEQEGQEEEVMLMEQAYRGNVLVCCSCGEQDEALSSGCGCCGRLVHYREPACGGWVFDGWDEQGAENFMFWCLACLENGLP